MNKPEEVLIVAGEISGDMLGSLAMTHAPSTLHFFGAGGESMQKAGVELLYTTESFATIGFLEAALRFSFFKKAIRRLTEEAQIRNVLRAILVDFPGFNLRLAASLKKSIPGIQIMQISSPQIWASRYHRIHKIRSSIDKILVFYPFEEKLYRRENIPAVYTGHPRTQELDAAFRKYSGKRNKKLITIMPGSRHSEIERHMPILIKSVADFSKSHPEYKFVIPVASQSSLKILRNYNLPQGMELSEAGATELLAHSSAAIVASGTATLEAAWMETPFFLVYRTSGLTYFLVRKIILIPYIGLVNVIAGRFLVPELIQKDMNAASVTRQLEQVVLNETMRREQKVSFQELKNQMKSRNIQTGLAREIAEFLHLE